MKHIKLLSVVALAVFGATAASGVVSAAPVLEGKTAGSIEFENDTTTIITPTDPENPGTPLPVDPKDPDYPNEIIEGANGDLFLAGYPKKFNFGKQKIGAADIFSGGIKTYNQEAKSAKIPTSTGFDDDKYSQAVAVHDGRIDKDDWSLSVQLSKFTGDNGATDTLKGTTITIENAATLAEFTGQEPTLVQGAKTEISQTSSVEFMKSNTKSKGDTSAVWANAEDVKIHVPASEITKGVHTATVDWTLVAGAN